MITAATLIVIIVTAIGGLHYIDSKIYVASKKDNSTKKENKNDVTNKVSAFQSLVDSVSNQNGVDNIILAGTDARSKETDSRTDSIMMATIDRTNKEVKLTSFMRDMYVPITGYKKNYKINTAYFLGGPDLLIQTLNQNFNTNAEYYVTIDFSAFKTLVDKFNGINIDVKPYEINQMNKYIKEENWHNPDFIKTAGLQHLNGQQALSYCRIRKVGNNDYERTERQRTVLSLLIQKARKESIFELPGLLNTILPYIKTNIPSSKLLAFGMSAYKFGNSSVNTIRVPIDGTYSSQVIDGQDVLLPDLQKNTNLLNKFITSNNLVLEKSNTSASKNNSNASSNLISYSTKTSNFNYSRSANSRMITSSSLPQRDNIDIAILNSTGKAGLASVYKARLEALGYKVTQTGNYSFKKYSSTIINDYSNQDFGNTLFQDLKFGNVTKKQKAKPLASIVIILGNDSEIN
jgi:polyisoprenyl-teichoic acid--peptidoglycan teichoic acid transferase